MDYVIHNKSNIMKASQRPTPDYSVRLLPLKGKVFGANGRTRNSTKPQRTISMYTHTYRDTYIAVFYIEPTQTPSAHTKPTNQPTVSNGNNKAR